MQPQSKISEPLTLKKYANRRYYDASQSCHLTLREILEVVKAGRSLVVTDRATGNDITAQVLTQILIEFEMSKLDALPVSLLVYLIRQKNPSANELREFFPAPAASVPAISKPAQSVQTTPAPDNPSPRKSEVMEELMDLLGD